MASDETEFKRYLNGELGIRIQRAIRDSGRAKEIARWLHEWDISFDDIKDTFDEVINTAHIAAKDWGEELISRGELDKIKEEVFKEEEEAVARRLLAAAQPNPDSDPQQEWVKMVEPYTKVEFWFNTRTGKRGPNTKTASGAASATNSADTSSISGVKPVSLKVVSVNLIDSNTIDLVVTTA